MLSTIFKGSLQSLLLIAISLSALPIISAAPARSLDSLPAGTVVRIVQLKETEQSEIINANTYASMVAPNVESEKNTISIAETTQAQYPSTHPNHSVPALDTTVESRKYVELMREIRNRQMMMGGMGSMSEMEQRKPDSREGKTIIQLTGHGDG